MHQDVIGMKVGLGPGDMVLDGDQASQKREGGTAAPHFSDHVLWPNGRMDQYVICHKWVHKKCSGIKGSMYKVMRSFI